MLDGKAAMIKLCNLISSEPDIAKVILPGIVVAMTYVYCTVYLFYSCTYRQGMQFIVFWNKKSIVDQTLI